jgi:hypothetical protein
VRSIYFTVFVRRIFCSRLGAMFICFRLKDQSRSTADQINDFDINMKGVSFRRFILSIFGDFKFVLFDVLY